MLDMEGSIAVSFVEIEQDMSAILAYLQYGNRFLADFDPCGQMGKQIAFPQAFLLENRPVSG